MTDERTWTITVCECGYISDNLHNHNQEPIEVCPLSRVTSAEAEVERLREALREKRVALDTITVGANDDPMAGPLLDALREWLDSLLTPASPDEGTSE